jgi:TPR repeat protein
MKPRSRLIAATASFALVAYGGVHFSRLPAAQVDLLAMQTAQGHPQARWQLLAAAFAGNVRAVRARGLLLLAGKTPRSERSGIRLLEQAAKGGEDEAALDLGRLYFWGLPGLRPNYGRARSWLEPVAAKQPAAAYYLALIDNNGLTGAANRTKAIEELKRAAEGGIADALFLLGNAYRSGDGVALDDAEAVRCYEKAAVLEHAGALQALAEAYARGDLGLNRNDVQSRQLFALAGDALRDPPHPP